MQQIMQRRTQIAKGLMIPEEGGLSIKAQAASLQARPSGSGPAVSGGPFGPPGGPTQGREWGPSQFRPASASPASPSATSPARAHAHERVSNSLQNVGGSAVAANSLQDVLRSKVSELDYLNSLLIRQAEEKRNIEHQRYQLAAENHNLKVQVQEMRTRQRPWSASSAGSRPQWHDQREPQQQGTSIHMHTIQEQRQPQLVAQRPPSSHIRPASASQHNNRVLVRKHPVFGTDSLMHRSVYTPTQGLENADGEAMASPPKDEVFLRPEAHRTLGFGPQEPDNSRGITAMRLRPQSANAAVRQISVRPVSGVRPGSARPHSSYAERLLHADADNFARFHVPLPSEDVTQRVIKALSVMRNAAGKRFVRVVDFMAPFDKLKRGHLSCTEFRRSLESCACFGDISEEEYNLVFSFFLHESTAVADVLSPTSRISYAAFCEVLQPVGDKRVKLNVDQEVLKNIGQQKQKASHSPLASNELSKEGESKLLTLIRCIIDAIRKNRISVRDFLERLDPRSASGHGNSKSLPTSPNVNHTTGCMSRSQYLRVRNKATVGMKFCLFVICWCSWTIQ